MGTTLKVDFTVRNLQFVNAALRGLEGKLRAKVIRKGLRAGGKVLLEGVRRRMPVDAGVARDSLYLKAWGAKRRNRIGISVQYRTVVVKAHAPMSSKRMEGFFYPATIEYGAIKLHRKPVAPMQRTLEGDGPRAVTECIDVIEAGSAKITKNLLASI